MRHARILNLYLLESSEFFIKEVNNHCAEHKAGEYGEKASNACKCPDEADFSHDSFACQILCLCNNDAATNILKYQKYLLTGHLECIWIPAVSGSGTGSICRQWRCSV